MPMLGSVTKQPSETELYSIDYSNDLDSVNTFVILGTAVVDLEGSLEGLPIIDTALIDPTAQQVKLFVSGGTAGSIYKITVRIQTDTGRILEDDFKLKIKDY